MMADHQEDISSGRKDKEDDGNIHEEGKDDDEGEDADLVIYLVFHLVEVTSLNK